MNKQIETFRGKLPPCLWCKKGLKANYESSTEPLYHGTGAKKVWLPENPDHDYPPPDDPTKAQEDADHCGKIFWSVKKQKWYKLASYQKVTRRKFKGTFGCRGSGFFCKTECAWKWANRKARELYQNPNRQVE